MCMQLNKPQTYEHTYTKIVITIAITSSVHYVNMSKQELFIYLIWGLLCCPTWP